jgi:hypothetical protein
MRVDGLSDGQTGRNDKLTILRTRITVKSVAHRKSLLLCFVWISKKTAIIFLYKINLIVSVIGNECVYLVVRNEEKYIYIS